MQSHYIGIMSVDYVICTVVSTGLKDCVRYRKILKNMHIIRYNKLHDSMAFSLCSLFIAEINPHNRVHTGR